MLDGGPERNMGQETHLCKVAPNGSPGLHVAGYLVILNNDRALRD
jgi:hypothetical protein